ncbi:hypothetical protein BaRGS_00014498 [Batillaria attramentaria]|uniref:Uncharacterized protein n=1 Tax=Batillaria attramentaria TaxID=370345 RepID=A0ABD0L3W2_9CAEN
MTTRLLSAEQPIPSTNESVFHGADCYSPTNCPTSSFIFTLLTSSSLSRAHAPCAITCPLGDMSADCTCVAPRPFPASEHYRHAQTLPLSRHRGAFRLTYTNLLFITETTTNSAGFTRSSDGTPRTRGLPRRSCFHKQGRPLVEQINLVSDVKELPIFVHWRSGERVYYPPFA